MTRPDWFGQSTQPRKRVDAPQPWIEDPMSVSEERLGTAQLLGSDPTNRAKCV